MLKVQSDFLEKRIMKRVGYPSKKIVDGCTVDISQELKDKRQKIDTDVYALIKKLENNPKKIVEYLNEHDIEVYCVKSAKRTLKLIKESEGFITERRGLTAFWLNLSVGNGFKLKTKAMIYLTGELDVYRLIRYFYSWYSWKEGLKGFDEKSKKLLKKLHDNDEDKVIARLSLQDMDLLQDAIARDVQAIEFVTKYSKENEGTKNALNKIQNEGSANI